MRAEVFPEDSQTYMQWSILAVSAGLLGFLDFRPYHLKSLLGPGVRHAAHASDEVERIPVQPSIFQMFVVQVNGNDLADHQAAAGGRGREVKNLMKLALEAHRRFPDSRRTYNLRCRRSESRQLEFVH